MAKSVLELAVGTGQWDAGLKKAKSALDNFTQANGGLQQALDKESQKMQQFVRMMGSMESTAKTAKGQMNDYKGTIEQLTMQYNRMTDAQKKAIGQDYLQAIDQMKQKYQSVNEEIQEMNRSLNNVKLPDMKDGGGGLFSGLGDKMGGALQVFAGNMLTKAAGALANLGSEMTDMVKQGVELARQGEGIRIAFERLGRGDILDGLREATHGTVTDLELMKAAVKFNDFKLPVEELGTMLAFAQQKAKDTGQSVDYMVDSIVTGLGRKSLMILDNLGLSATEVKEKMKETGDMTKAVGEIIREQMAKAGDYVETAADRAAQANVNLQNKMEELGRKFAPVEEASSQLWTSMKIGILDIIGGPLATLLNQLTEAGRLKNQLNNMNGGGMMERFGNNLRNSKDPSTLYSRQLAAINRSINTAEAKLQQAEKGGMGSIQIYRERVQALKEVKKQYEDLYKTITSPAKNPLIASDADNKKTKKGGGKTKTVKTEEQLNNEEIQKLTQEYIKASDERRKAIEGEIKTLQDRNAEIKRLMEAAQGKVAPEGSLKALSEELSKLQQERQLLSDPIDIELHDQAIKDVQDEIDRLNGKKVEVELAVDSRTPFEKLKDSLKIEIAEENMQVDTTTLQTLMKTAIQNGIDGLDPNFSALQEKMREGMNIPDSAWEELQTQINEKLKDLGIEPIKIDFKTGNISNGKQENMTAKAMEKFNGDFSKVTGGVSSIVSGIQQMGVDIPNEIQNIFGVLSGISSVMTGITAILTLIEIDTKTTAAASVTDALIPFARGGIVPHAANGYFVPGNNYSGDTTPIMANAGELVLNKAQQSTLAQNLQGSGGGNFHLVGRLAGEDIIISAERAGQRMGYGQLMFWKGN